MKVEKKVISNLTLCYCVAPLLYQGEPHFLVASEKEYPCLLFDSMGKQVEEIWKEPGGTMSAVQLPGADGAFLAVQKFYSPNRSKEAKIVLCWRTEDGWKVRTLVELPYVHRFDILQRDGRSYLLACCLKSGYEYKDDWRFPGKTYACPLPENLVELPAGEGLSLTLLKDNMLKNHGYSRHIKNGVMTGIVTSDEGVFRFTPPASGEEAWTIEQMLSDPASDAVLVDFDGDGEEEILTISPFHGDTLRIYHKGTGGYRLEYEYEKKLAFAHAICAANIGGENIAVVGHRKAGRDLLAVRYRNGYFLETIDQDVGPANVLHSRVSGEDILIAANRETNEVAYYTVTLN